ncbi:hypothetical protein IJH27_01590 [Candidatus Saccharibacteria bacterium]|nr:hypothetical protein [Candidatus Saccharibacteria bacterium]
MAKKNSTKPSKSTTKKTSKKVVSRPKAVKKDARATEPYHIVFGLIVILVGVITILALITGLTLALCGRDIYHSDAKRFSSLYAAVEKDNIFVFKSGKETVNILKSGTGVVFLGFPSCPWCQAYAPMLNALAKEYGLDAIYYHDTYDDWKNNTVVYQELTTLLSDYLQYDNVGEKHLYVPDVVFVIDGKIIGNDWETSKDTLGLETPEAYWTEERVEAWRKKVSKFFAEIKEATK